MRVRRGYWRLIAACDERGYVTARTAPSEVITAISAAQCRNTHALSLHSTLTGAKHKGTLLCL